MATYGPGKKPTQPAKSSRANSRSGSVKDHSGGTPRGTARSTSSELRSAVEGREHEFIGLGLIVVGILLGLGVYLNLAGPLGRGVEEVAGWVTGLGRYVAPVALIGIGVALVHKYRSEHRVRLVFGWGLGALAVLAILHIVRGPDRILANVD